MAVLPDPNVARKLPYHFAKSRGVIVARELDDGFEVWLRDGVGPAILSEARRVLGRPLTPVLIGTERFEHELAAVYTESDNAAERLVDSLEQDVDLQRLAQTLPQVADLLEAQDDAPIIRLINALFTQALRDHASDIHVEPFETRSRVRFRVDGVLRDVIEPQRALHAAIVSRIKVMAQLDIAEKRLPQDGRMSLRVAGRIVDVRVSTLPTGHGERVVLRLLDRQAGVLDLASLGMREDTLAALNRLVHEPHGIVLVTGPTGSGKTTTLYAALSELDTGRLNIMTAEDPIEYDLDGIGQTQVNSRIELSFARALRAMLRQDPDVVMIGEIRDLETAQIAVQASLTGHLVLATLHTNDAIGAVTRLVDMGVEQFLLASSLIGILAQRLVRKLCQQCKRAHPPDATERALLGFEVDTIYSATGCALCNHSGYRGRTGIYELLTIDEAMRRLIHDNVGEQGLRDHALDAIGMRTLRTDGMRWVAQGVTTLEEVLRVAR